jgi:adenylate cyclase
VPGIHGNKIYMFLAFLKKLFAGRGTILISLLLVFLSVFITVTLYFNQNQLYERTVSEDLLDILLVFTLGLLSFYLIRRNGYYVAFLTSALLSVGLVWTTLFLIGERHWVNILFPLLVVILALLIGGAFRYLVLESNARELRSLFSNYQSDKLVARLEEEPEAAKIGGDCKDVTIIFTDIKDFTAFSEKHTPQEVVERLNEYLGEMVQVIEEFDGYVDKFIGDGIMAYWGAPLAQPGHAKLAIACVLAMRKKMEGLCVKWQAEGVEPFVIRAGVQSGEVVAGNVGLRGKKMEYTVIGDTVNQAARLESSAKYYGVDALVGENTYHRTCGVYSYRELDKIRMMGKQVPVTVYELTESNDLEANELNEKFTAALAVYRGCNWEDAEKLFVSILAEFPHDRPSEIYLERCRYFIGNPAPYNWDGVFNRRGK